MKKKKLYEFLGVEPEATPEEIKTAALSLAEKFHPSKYPGNPRVAARFKKIKRV
jgi:curved DNA-binding protein CbpA